MVRIASDNPSPSHVRSEPLRRPRFSIASILAIIGIVGIALAAFRDPSYLWASVTFSTAFAALVLAIINVLYSRGARRAYWAGFALCGWAYFAICSVPGLRVALPAARHRGDLRRPVSPRCSPATTARARDGTRPGPDHAPDLGSTWRCGRPGRDGTRRLPPRAAGRPGASRTAPMASATRSAPSPWSAPKPFVRSAIRWRRSWWGCWAASTPEAATRRGRRRTANRSHGERPSLDAGSEPAASRGSFAPACYPGPRIGQQFRNEVS